MLGHDPIKLIAGNASSNDIHSVDEVESASSATLDSLKADEGEIFLEGNYDYAHEAKATIENAAGGKNVIATAFLCLEGDSNEDKENNRTDLLVCGGVDATISFYAISSTGCRYSSEPPQKVYSLKTTAPVLTLAVQKTTVVAGLMDGSVYFLYCSHIRDSSRFSEETPISVICKEHNKYVVGLKWSRDGLYLVSISHDKSMVVYKNAGLGEMERWKYIQFSAEQTPESIEVFTTPDNQYEAVIGLRGASYLTYMNLDSFEIRKISINANAWDTHVSFTPLYLSLSPDMKFLVMATDKNQHIVLYAGKEGRARVLAGGHIAGDYAKPVVLWHHSGRYLYSNSEEEGIIYIYSLATERIATKVLGHKSILRAMAMHPHREAVVTGSYDKSVIVWE